MKRLFMLLCAVVAFAACKQIYVDVVSDIAAGDRCLSVSFEGEDTRIQLNEAQKTVWTEGDILSVFYRSTVNEEWQFKGKTGDRTGDIVPVDNTLNPPYTHNRVVVIYPYNENYYLNTETYSIEASLPAVQNYLKDSYGTNGNIMVSSSDYKQVSLKSVCGWLKVQLTGDGEVVKSITLRGNNGEQVAGEIHINTSDATCVVASASGDAGESEVGGTLVRPGTILTEVTLDCGDGVTLGEEATAFYIALPPQTFEQGFTVEIEDTEGYVMEQSTDKALTIERNHIQPMAAFEFINPNHPTQPTPASNEIWYTSFNGKVVTPDNTSAFGANITSNTYNNGMGIITFDGDVTSIGNKAFFDCDSLTSVTIPDSVTTIGEYVFYSCDSLTSVTIPDSVTKIGSCAFYCCSSLTSVTIPDSVTEIGDYAFCGCSSLTEFKGKFAEDNGRVLVIDGTLVAFAPNGLSEYTIPDSVTKIGERAFYKCSSLTSVTIPDSVTTIGEHAFNYCKSLTSVYCKATTPPVLGNSYVFEENGSSRKIYVPTGSVNAYKSATRWSEYADAIVGCDFEKDEIVEMQPNNEIWYTSSDGNVVKPYETNVFGANIISNTYTDGKGVIIFDGDVTTIGKRAFYDCIRLTSVTIPDSVTAIGERAFQYCDNLQSVNMLDGLSTIGKNAFYYCENLKDVTIGNNVETIGDQAFCGCKSITNIVIPDSITTIGSEAFKSCSALENVTFGHGIKDIGYGAFCKCGSLNAFEGWLASDDGMCLIIDGRLVAFICDCPITPYTFPENVTVISKRSVLDCETVTEFIIPDTVTSIESSAFEYCFNLKKLTIGANVETIGYWAFSNCFALKTIYCRATTPPKPTYYDDEWLAFDEELATRKIYVPMESVEAYKNAEGWSIFADKIVGYDF